MMRFTKTGINCSLLIMLGIMALGSCSRCIECKMEASGRNKAVSFDLCQREKETDQKFKNRVNHYREMGYKCD